MLLKALALYNFQLEAHIFINDSTNFLQYLTLGTCFLCVYFAVVLQHRRDYI